MNNKVPERFWVDYVMEATSAAHARQLAKELCLEQTVELPGKLDAVKSVEAYTVGSIEQIHDLKLNKLFKVTIGFPNDTAGNELTQFLNVVFGNTSLKKGVAVQNVTLSKEMQENRTMFPGPNHGIQGLRSLLQVPQAPLLMTALKPMGASSQHFADMAYQLAKGGMDIIKDDHGLANQVWAPYHRRVRLCAQAVQRANRETCRHAIYAACVNGPHSEIIKRAHYAKEVGAGAIMVLPGISGWDVVRELAADRNFNLPILVHPALLGGWLDSDDDDQFSTHIHHPHGLSHEFLFGVLPRLCGADAVIFPNAGGRFQFTPQECQAVAEGCRRPLNRFHSILPCPAGGMKLNRVHEMRQTFGDNTLFLIGGALLEQGPDLELDAKLFAHNAGRDDAYHSVKRGSSISETKHVIEDDSTALPSVKEVERTAENVRRRVLEYTLHNNGGYLSQACSSAETLATLYLRALRLGPSVADQIPGPFRGSPSETIPTVTGESYNGDLQDPSLDRLIFSPVHYALVLYSLLVEVGRLSIEAFQSYNVDGSTVELIGAEHSPGHGVTAGSLAQGLSQSAGIAYARKLKGHTGRVICYMSDGEFQEGQAWEAVQAAVFHKIHNLVAVVDVNGQQCDGKMVDVCEIGNLARKLQSFGAHVQEVDGHSIEEIETAVNSNDHEKPTIVLCHTDPCHGLPLLQQRAPKLHYVRFKDVQEKQVWKNVLMEMDQRMETRNGRTEGDCERNQGSCKSKRKPEVVNHDRNVRRQKIGSPAERKTGAMIENHLDQSFSSSSIEMVTRPHRNNLLIWARKHPQALILTADLTASCEADLLRDELPDQYLSMGMAEQNMMSFAGGLAREGFHPYIHTFAVFVTRRPFDQVAMSIAVPNLPVRLLGFLPGLTTPGGVTHQAIDDVALMRSIPNMSVLEVGDATEVESVLDVAESIPGPVYIRMWRGQVPRLFPKSFPMQYGRSRLLTDGSDVALVTAGITTEEAVKIRPLLVSSGISVHHVHLSTLVPFPSEVIIEAAQKTKHGIIVMENHSIVGGIGSATAEALAELGIGKRLVRLGVPGVYAHGASREYLMKEYGFDSTSLCEAIGQLVGKKVHGPVAEDTNHRRNVSSSERPEDL